MLRIHKLNPLYSEKNYEKICDGDYTDETYDTQEITLLIPFIQDQRNMLSGIN